jgi:prepilin-type N-terminal cleavage/methylation domain-containing protein
MSQSGFTVIELMVVIGIAAVLFAVLSVGIRRASDSFALRRAGVTVVSEVRRAQGAAVAERVDYAVEFVLGTPGGLRVSRAKLASETCPTGMETTSATLCERILSAPNQWPASVSVAADASPPVGMGSLNAAPDCTAAGAGNKCVIFQFLGSPASVGGQATGTVLLQSTSGVRLRIGIAAGTGKVSVLQ